MKQSLVKKLIEFAKEKRGWVNGSQFEQFALNQGKKASNGSRRCRELANEGVFERRINGKSVEYRLKMVEIPIVGAISEGKINYTEEYIKSQKLSARKLL